MTDDKKMNVGISSGLSPKAEKLIRALSTLTVLGLAISAAILSFSGLQELSIKAGISHSIAWLLPVVVDGMVLTGSLGVVSSSLVGIGTWYPWTLTILGVSASIAGNVAIAPHNLSARLVHAAGPVTFALSIEGLLRIYRASAEATVHREKDKVAKEEQEYERETKALERAARREQRKQEVIKVIDSPVSASQDIAQSVKPVVALKENKKTVSGGTRDKIRELWLNNQDISGGDVAKTLGVDPSYARKTLRYLRANEQSSSESKSEEMSQEVEVSNHEERATTALEGTHSQALTPYDLATKEDSSPS